MQSTSLNKSSSIHPIQREETSDRHASKSLRQNQGTDPKQKLVNWYEQAYAYYGAVISGAESKPDSKAWQGFLDQMEWASDQLGYAGPQATNLELGGFPQGSDDSSGFPQQEVPNGASVGPMGTLVWNSPTADITDVGGHETHDIWSNEVHLAVASVGATVTSEITTDTRLSPPEQVLKIVVKDKSTGSESVYFVHDYEDAKITIKTPAQKQVQDSSSGLVAWEEYKAGGTKTEDAKKDASMAGVVQDDGSIVYEPEFAGAPIQFWANPGEDQTHVVYSDAKIATKPSDEVTVTKKSDGTVEVLVKHKDGSKDTYEVKKGYKVDIQANAEYVTLAGKAASEGVPEELKNRVTLNGGVSKTEDDDKGGINSDDIIDNLMTAAGLEDPDQLLGALQDAGYNYKDKAALKKAIESGEFPPAKPDDKLIKFLFILDPVFKSAMAKGGKEKGKIGIEHAYTLLKALYPKKIVSKNIDDDDKSYHYTLTLGDVVIFSQSGSTSAS